MTSIFRPEPEFTLRIPDYNKVDHLHGTMVEFGKFILKYKAPKGVAEPDWKRKISAEATLPEMLAFFEKFLQDAGYVFVGNLVLYPTTQAAVREKHWDAFWELRYEDESRDNN